MRSPAPADEFIGRRPGPEARLARARAALRLQQGDPRISRRSDLGVECVHHIVAVRSTVVRRRPREYDFQCVVVARKRRERCGDDTGTGGRGGGAAFPGPAAVLAVWLSARLDKRVRT
jgi:hypothetical protein